MRPQCLLAALALAACGSDGRGDLPPCPAQPDASSCTSGSCIGEAWTAGGGKLGTACALSKDCQSGLCATDPSSGQKYCTQTCDPAAQTPCPNGAECLAAENAGSTSLNVCGPPACR